MENFDIYQELLNENENPEPDVISILSINNSGLLTNLAKDKYVKYYKSKTKNLDIFIRLVNTKLNTKFKNINHKERKENHKRYELIKCIAEYYNFSHILPDYNQLFSIDHLPPDYQVETEIIICPNCNNELYSDTNVCDQCGRVLDEKRGVGYQQSFAPGRLGTTKYPSQSISDENINFIKKKIKEYLISLNDVIIDRTIIATINYYEQHKDKPNLWKKKLVVNILKVLSPQDRDEIQLKLIEDVFSSLKASVIMEIKREFEKEKNSQLAS